MTAPPWVPKLQHWASSRTLHPSPLPLPPPVHPNPSNPHCFASHRPEPAQVISACLWTTDHSPFLTGFPTLTAILCKGWADTFQFYPDLHMVYWIKLKQLDLKNKASTICLLFVSVIASSHYAQHLALGTLDGISFHILPISCVILFLMLTFPTLHLEDPSPTPISPSWST